jgi:glycosyltransferase involved in cell wall biosynthesis
MTEHSPVVSIIIPAYNTEKFIRQCMDSVIAQTYQNWEAIVIYAPSEDDTLARLENYRSDLRITIIIEDQKTTLAAARNTGIAASQGKYIAMLDSDDWWEPEKLETMVRLMESRPELKWCTHYLAFHRGDEIVYLTRYPAKTYRTTGVPYSFFRADYLEEIKQQWGYIFRGQMYWGEDMDLALRIKDDPSELIPAFLSHYRFNPEGLSQRITPHEARKEMTRMILRNRAFHFLPHHLRDCCLIMVSDVIHRDTWPLPAIVAFKKRFFG